MPSHMVRTQQPQSLVAQRLRRIARTRARLQGLQADLEQELTAARRPYEGRIATLQARLDRLHADLEAYCRGERDAILPPSRKSLVTQYGEVAFRRADAAVRLREGLAEGEVCRLLRSAGLDYLVRVRESPDKTAVRRAIRQEAVSPEQLECCGLELVEGSERFYCKVWQDALVEVGRNGR